MSKIHSYPFYFANWRSSPEVAKMTAEMRGIYRELLDYCWELGSLPSDHCVLRTFARCTSREWSRCKDTVLACFELRDGSYYNRKVDDNRPQLIENKKRRADASKSNGQSGGRPRKPSGNPVGYRSETYEKPSRFPNTNLAEPTHTYTYTDTYTNTKERDAAADAFSSFVGWLIDTWPLREDELRVHSELAMIFGSLDSAASDDLMEKIRAAVPVYLASDAVRVGKIRKLTTWLRAKAWLEKPINANRSAEITPFDPFKEFGVER